jgi:hypothetical protein
VTPTAQHSSRTWSHSMAQHGSNSL